MSRVFVLGPLILVAASCATTKPVPIATTDTCFRCRRPIEDTKLAAEVVTAQGYVLKFRTPWCMASFLAEHPQRLRAVFVTDYRSGKLVSASSAVFVRTVVRKETREEDFLAFSRADGGADAVGTHPPLRWDALQKFAATTPKRY